MDRPAETSPAAWAARLLPVCALGPLVLLATRQLSSVDLGFHLRAGNYILDGNGWPRNDPFTFTVNDHPYVDTSWGYQVLLALVERASGSAGLVLFHAALVLAAFALLVATARLRPHHPVALTALILLAGLAAEPRFEARPELWSYALLASTLYLLHRRAVSRAAPLWVLVPLFLVWGNSHSLFLLGWAALACFVIGSWLRDGRLDLRLAAWSAAAVAVTLINPYGWRAPVFAIGLATRLDEANVFARNIGEFRSPLGQLLSEQLRFYLVPLGAFFVLLALVLVSLPFLWRRRRLECLLLALVFVPLALAMVRNAPLLALACSPGILWAMARRRVVLTRRARAAAIALALISAVLCLRVYHDAYYVDARRLERFGLGWNGLVLPTGAADYVGRVGLRGPMLNHLNFGGYLLWAHPDPVFIDGRLEVMGETFFEQYRRALASPAGLEACVERYGIRWVVFPHRLRPDLLEGLSRDRRWLLVYVDQIAALFVRAGPGAGALVDASVHRLNRPPVGTLDPSSLPGLGGAPVEGRFLRWSKGLITRQEYPSLPVALGRFHLVRREASPAAEQFSEAIRRSAGAYSEIYGSLGEALIRMGRFREAAACLRVYLARLPLYRRELRRATRASLEELERAPSPGPG